MLSRVALLAVFLPALALGQAAPRAACVPGGNCTFNTLTVTNPGNLLTSTTAAVHLYVDPLGSDSQACTSPGTGACLTGPGVIAKISTMVATSVLVSIAAGSYAGGGGHLEGVMFKAGATPTAPGSILFEGPTNANFSPATGTATGTSTGSNTQGTNATRGVLNDSGATWTTSNLVGKILELTGGPGSGEEHAICANTGTAITICDVFATLPTSSSTYAIRTATAIFTGNAAGTAGTFDAASTTYSAAFWVDAAGGFHNPAEAAPPVYFHRLRFSTGVATAISVQRGRVGIVGCLFDGLSNHAVQWADAAAINAAANSFSIAGFRGFRGSSGSLAREQRIVGNVMTAGTYMYSNAGKVNTWGYRYNQVAATVAAVRLSAVDDGVSRFNTETAPSCFNGSFANNGLSSSALAWDANTCTATSGIAVVLSGPNTFKIDQAGVGASTIVESSTAVGLAASNGAKASFTSSTTWTNSGSASDFLINDSGDSGQAFTLAQLQSGSTHVMGRADFGTSIVLNGAAAGPQLWGGGFRPGPVTTANLSSCLTATRGVIQYDTTRGGLVNCDGTNHLAVIDEGKLDAGIAIGGGTTIKTVLVGTATSFDVGSVAAGAALDVIQQAPGVVPGMPLGCEVDALETNLAYGCRSWDAGYVAHRVGNLQLVGAIDPAAHNYNYSQIQK